MKKIRCAIYTRKSAEEGLEQEFNSLDAQREACAAYVASQKAEGWVLLPTVYEDAGLSGGTLERPGLQRLLADIDAGLVDQIVVYKVDRLTRSLSDFAKLVERLEAAGAVFVSVTQSFNTATSMGRLTLHMLLSFAQFEREVTAERIRDKVAASKRKGLWMGGRVPLGYEKDERTLRINEAEAETVRTLYALYRKHGTLRQVKAEADRLRLRTKQRFAADGTRTGGLPFRRGHLHCLLTNPLYAGRIRHQRRVYEGQHPSIIAPELWDAVQTQLQAGAAKPRRRTTKGRAARSPLAGKLFDETGDRLTPSHTKKKNGQRLRYYVSRRLIQHSGQKDLSGWRLPAPMLEQTVVHLIRQHVDATTFSASLIHTPTMQELASVRRFLDGLCSGSNDDSASAAPCSVLSGGSTSAPALCPSCSTAMRSLLASLWGPDRIREDALRILAPFRLRRRGVETKLVLGNPTKSVDRTLLRNIRNALSWLDRIKAGKTYEQIATENAIPTDRVRKAIRYAFLAPDIVRAIVEGRQPVGLTSSYLLHHPLPDDWEKQRVLVKTL